MPALSGRGWGRVTPPRRAMAFFNDAGLGVGVYSPSADTPWNCGVTGESASRDPAHADTVHVAPLATVALGRTGDYAFRYWLLVGDAPTLARAFDTLHTLPAERQRVPARPE